MKRVTRSTLLVGGLVLALVLGLAAVSSASSSGGSLPAGSSMCSDQARSSTGAAVSGIVSSVNARVTWTVTAADIAGGPETTIFRAVTDDVTGRTVAAPHAGLVFYRVCLSNTTTSPVSFFRVFASPPAGAAGALSGIGPTSAILGAGGTVCGELLSRGGHLTASSNLPVTWFVRAYNGDLSILRQVRPLTVTSTSVDGVIGPGAYAYLDVCAINHGASTATLSMQFA